MPKLVQFRRYCRVLWRFTSHDPRPAGILPRLCGRLFCYFNSLASAPEAYSFPPQSTRRACVGLLLCDFCRKPPHTGVSADVGAWNNFPGANSPPGGCNQGNLIRPRNYCNRPARFHFKGLTGKTLRLLSKFSQGITSEAGRRAPTPRHPACWGAGAA